MKNPRIIFFFIILITLFAVYINLPPSFTLQGNTYNIKYNPNYLVQRYNLGDVLEFRQGLDLKGGVSITFQADVEDIPVSERENALESAKAVIERRINLYGVSEPLIQTAKADEDFRIIVELPGISKVEEAINLVGATAQLTFWETTQELDPQLATSSAYPINAELINIGPLQKTELSGSDLSSSAVVFDPNTGMPQVQLRFNSQGATKFAEITQRNVGKPVAIVLDNVIIEAPNVNEAILTGDAVISGNFTQETAKALSTQLNAGALPVSLEVLQQRVIGPSLGQESLDKSLMAGIIGFTTVVIFMILIYGKLGIVASLALIIYALLNLAVFKLSNLTPFGITITLAGVAGFILSIGMAVDANILIFERMREEKRAGKGRASQIEQGFARAWTSIRDSNVSTLITCVILYSFGTGIVRGFALILAIGVLISMFSAITITRSMLRLTYK
jgi:preprotein translocase subunit SecD